MWIQTFSDANCRWAVIVDNEPNLIGREYKFKPLKGKVVKESYDEEELHYWHRKSKPRIPEGTELKVDCWWMNLYGDYFRFEYNGNKYDVKTDNIELSRYE